MDAAGNISKGVTAEARPAPELLPPVGSVTIEEGLSVTAERKVVLQLDAMDPSGVTHYCLSTRQRDDCKRYREMEGTVSVRLRGGSEERTVYVWYKDTYGNVSHEPETDTIFVDTKGPEGGTVMGASVADGVELTWSGFTDDNGVSQYLVMSDVGRNPSSRCSSGTLLYAGTNNGYAHTGLVGGTSYRYRVCPVDDLGNVGAGEVFKYEIP